jgi:hypothetical protein
MYSGRTLANSTSGSLKSLSTLLQILQHFKSNEDKVLFAMSHLCGQALAWFQPDLLGGLSENEPEPAWASDFVTFISELVVNFGLHDPVGDAKLKLELLQMQDSERITGFLVKL